MGKQDIAVLRRVSVSDRLGEAQPQSKGDLDDSWILGYSFQAAARFISTGLAAARERSEVSPMSFEAVMLHPRQDFSNLQAMTCA